MNDSLRQCTSYWRCHCPVWHDILPSSQSYINMLFISVSLITKVLLHAKFKLIEPIYCTWIEQFSSIWTCAPMHMPIMLLLLGCMNNEWPLWIIASMAVEPHNNWWCRQIVSKRNIDFSHETNIIDYSLPPDKWNLCWSVGSEQIDMGRTDYIRVLQLRGRAHGPYLRRRSGQ